MSIFRVTKDKSNPYVMMNKHALEDTKISWKAKGILAYLLSLPDDWKLYESELTQHSEDGIKGTRSGIKELIEAGYIKREIIRTKEGHFKGYEYQVYEVPTESLKAENRKTENRKEHTTNNNFSNNDLNDILHPLKMDDSFLSFYLRQYKIKFNKNHPRVREGQEDYIYNCILTLREHDIELPDWQEKVVEYFDELPESNNGNILSFFKASMRLFEVHLEDVI